MRYNTLMPRKQRAPTSTAIVLAARDNRHQATATEEKLWQALRARRLAGLKFRRQYPCGHFILEFFCLEARLAVEADGAGHLQPEQAAYDQQRSLALAEQGIRVLRFSNDEIEQNLAGVLERIRLAANTEREG